MATMLMLLLFASVVLSFSYVLKITTLTEHEEFLFFSGTKGMYGDKTGRSRQNDLLRIESLKIAKQKMKIFTLHVNTT